MIYLVYTFLFKYLFYIDISTRLIFFTFDIDKGFYDSLVSTFIMTLNVRNIELTYLARNVDTKRVFNALQYDLLSLVLKRTCIDRGKNTVGMLC